MKMSKLRIAVTAALLMAIVSVLGISQVIGLNPDFDATAAEEEAYWYSRYNLGHLTMRSGMGESFMPDPAMVEMMIRAVDADPGDGDTVMVPVNAALLRTVYASGSSDWIGPANPMDFATMRWDPTTFDTRITGSAMGWTMIKELEWAKQFHVDEHFGVPEDNFGAQWRFVGMVMTAMAKMQAMSWMDLHAAGEMVMVDQSDPFVMLMAISDLAQLLAAETMPHSASNRYRDAEGATMFLGVANEQFDRVIVMPANGMNTKELATAIQGLVWYASVTADAQRQVLALERIEELGEQLISSPKETAADGGYALRGLIEAYRVTGCLDCLHASLDVFEELALDYDAEHGLFVSQMTYTIDDVAAIIGGLNAVKIFGNVNLALVEEIFSGFFEGVINLSGLQRSVPPIAESKGDFEQDEPVIYYGYPGMPLPNKIGTYGAAPVFATSVTFDPACGLSTVSDERFDTAGAMHAANEFIWMHFDEVSGFPEVERISATAADASPAAVSEEQAVSPENSIIGYLLLAGIAAGLVVYLLLNR